MLDNLVLIIQLYRKLINMSRLINETNEAIAKVIKDQIESYILAKAADLGAEISVVLLFEENNWYQPERVTISGSASPFARNQLKSYIATDLGIPEESQIWILQ